MISTTRLFGFLEFSSQSSENNNFEYNFTVSWRSTRGIKVLAEIWDAAFWCDNFE